VPFMWWSTKRACSMKWKRAFRISPHQWIGFSKPELIMTWFVLVSLKWHSASFLLAADSHWQWLYTHTHTYWFVDLPFFTPASCNSYGWQCQSINVKFHFLLPSCFSVNTLYNHIHSTYKQVEVWKPTTLFFLEWKKRWWLISYTPFTSLRRPSWWLSIFTYVYLLTLL